MASRVGSPQSSLPAEGCLDEAASKAEQYARDRIAALLEDSDEEESLTGASPSKIASFFSSSPHSLQQNNVAAYDINLDDEVLPVPAKTHHVQGAGLPVPATEDDGTAAYDRLKNLFSKPSETPHTDVRVGQVANLSKAKANSSPQSSMSQDSEDDMPVRKSRPVPRRVMSSSPAGKSVTPRQARNPSPGLFVSPASSPVTRSSPRQGIAPPVSDSDDMPNALASNSRLKQLIAQKKAERALKESVEREKLKETQRHQAKKQKRLAKQYKEIYSSEMDDGTTEEAQNLLTENSRPSQRKASKKALEEMNRETQRIARNQQLTHQSRVKRKLTTADFAKSFGMHVESSPKSNEDKRICALDSSDTEAGNLRTPPSSPPSISNHKGLDYNEEDYLFRTGPSDSTAIHEDDGELPTLTEVLSQPVPRLDKGKGKMGEPTQPHMVNALKTTRAGNKQVHVVLPAMATENLVDDDLEIVQPKKSRFAVFDRLHTETTKQSASLLNLRALAHVRSPTKDRRKGWPSITATELQMRLAREMQKQTVAEKREKIEMLKSRGIYFKTDEEIEEDQMFVENMLEKARKEAMELGLKEKQQAEKNGEEIDENYVLPSDDESNEEFQEDELEEDEAELELSGSEDEDDEGASNDDEIMETNDLIDDAAEDASDEEKQDSDEDINDNLSNHDHSANTHDGSEDNAPATLRMRPPQRARKVILDDEDDNDDDVVRVQPSTITAAVSLDQTQTSPINAFGFAPPQASVGLTQMFQSSLADAQSQDVDVQTTENAPNIDFLRNFPMSTLPGPSPSNPVQEFLVQDSQSVITTPAKLRPRSSMPISLITTGNATHAPITSQMSPTKFSELPDPTPDAGFERPSTSLSNMPQSTIETVMMPITESPIAEPKKGRLRRRAEVLTVLSEDEADDSESDADGGEDDGFELHTNAFDALFKAAKQPPQAEIFDKKHSKAKNMFEEQAEESEDEYAGLGGASDDDSDNGMDEELQQMIDEGPVDIKEGELAQLYADKDRADDEKRVDKLYRDITTGALRKKRGAGIDELSDDSDDEAAERRRQKQREFAKMRRALLEDEHVGKLAENPRKLAFFRAIEDRDDEDGVDYLDELLDDITAIPESQPNGTQDLEAPVQSKTATSDIDLKRTLPFATNAAPAATSIGAPNMSHRRRPVADNGFYARPTSITEIREQLSFLIDEPLVRNSQVEDQSDDDNDDGNDGPVIRRRNDGNGSAFGTVLSSVRASVINRITISRQNSLDTEEDSQSGPMAFHTGNASSTSLFKVPSLLRRATTNMSNTSTEAGANTPTTTIFNSNQENAVRRGGSKKSNIHFQAREAERMKKVQDVERRRKEGIRKSVVGRGKTSVLGKSLGGGFNGFE